MGQMRQKVETNETKKLRHFYDTVFEMGQMRQKVETNLYGKT
jgi:hypothetical protein